MKTYFSGIVAASAVVATTLALGSAQLAQAGFPSRESVTMGGEPLFRINGPALGYTPEHRAQIVQDNLDNALATAPSCSPELVTTGEVNGAVVVLFNNKVIATADSISAQSENLSPAQLAEKWAGSIKAFLSDKQRAEAYRISLIGHQPIEGSTVYVERRLYAPQGTSLPVVFDMPLSSASLKPGQTVTAKLSRNVAIGPQLLIPAGSIVVGTVVEEHSKESFGDLAVIFTDLKTPAGTETPIYAFLTTNLSFADRKPHPVCTLSMPAGMITSGRVPAMVAIGSTPAATEQVAFVPGSYFEIQPGQEVSVVLGHATQVAIIEREKPL